MRDTKYAYAVACVRAKEPELLTKSFIERLADASSFDDTKKILIDRGFLQFQKNSDISAALSDYMSEVWDFLFDITPDKDALQFLIIKNDFHNLKALIKGYISGDDGRKYCISPCVLDIDNLYDAIVKKDFENLPYWLEDVAKKAYEILTSTMDGQIFDMYVDLSSLKVMKKFSVLAKCNLAKDITELFVALTNIKISVRLAGTTKGNSFLDNAFCPCDTLDISELKKAVIKGRNDILSYIQTTKYGEICDSISKSVTDFEIQCDNMFIELLDSARYISVGPEPLICYYYAKELEWKMLRIVISGKYIGIPAQAIRERICELYV